MDNLDKVEKLRERADVSYEEAKTALENNNWDMLDAMVYLERQGKAVGPQRSQYSTSYEQQTEYVPVRETVYDKDKGKIRDSSTVGTLLKRFLRICRDNSFCVNHKGSQIFKLPVIVLLLILLWTWKILLPLMIIGLFFNLRYSFEGKDDLKEANAVMDTAGQAAERVKEGFSKKSKE